MTGGLCVRVTLLCSTVSGFGVRRQAQGTPLSVCSSFAFDKMGGPGHVSVLRGRPGGRAGLVEVGLWIGQRDWL